MPSVLGGFAQAVYCLQPSACGWLRVILAHGRGRAFGPPRVKYRYIAAVMEFAGTDPIIVPAGEGKVLNVFGETITCKLYSEDTADAFSMYEVVTPPNGGPPLHQHLKEDETCFVLEGDYEVHCGNRRFKVGANMVFLLPRDVPHTYRNLSKTSSRMLVISAPGGVEKFYEELSQAPPEVISDPARLKKLARRHHIEIMGPTMGKASG